MRLASIASLVLGGLPLVIYPVLLVAGIMSLAGHRTGDEPLLLMAVSYAFLIGSLSYPIVYVCCLVIAVWMGTRGDQRGMLRSSIAPLAFIAVLGVVAWLWGRLESAYGPGG
jgi:hypothetical protein